MGINVNGARPEFDFSTYSHKQAILFDAEQKRYMRLLRQLDDETAFETDKEFESAVQKMMESIEKIEGYLCKMLVSVPRDWLVPDAPETLDWQNPESLGWLRQDKYAELQLAMAEAKSPESVTGNSENP